MASSTGGSSYDRVADDSMQLELPRAPSATLVWSRALVATSVVLGLFLLDQLSLLLLNFWLLDSMGYASVFWVNFEMGARLFVVGTVAMALAISLPAWLHGLSGTAVRYSAWVGLLVGLPLGYWLSLQYLEFLGPTGAVPFGEADPVFGKDISFYVFDLPALAITLQVALGVMATALVASIATALIGSRDMLRSKDISPTLWRFGRLATLTTRTTLALTGLLAAALVWLGRYSLLTTPNFEESTEFTGAGADYVDLVGFFSTKNSIYVEALAVLALTIGLVLKLGAARRALIQPGSVDNKKAFRSAAIALVILPGITTDLMFRAAVEIRENLFVVPNEPVIQLPYLQRHLEATNKAFGLADLEERTFVPSRPGDLVPDLQTLLDDPAIRNAPLWSGFISRFSRTVGPQYVERILLAEGDMNVYGPTLEILQGQQKLRAYYDFLDVDTIVSEVNGEPRMLASAVRELPQDILRPWFGAWGQRSLVFTHGYGLVSMPVSERVCGGDPVYATWGLPAQARFDSLSIENQSIYYGEGATRIAFSNAVGLPENTVVSDDRPAEVSFPRDMQAGVKVDSLLKRLVIGYQSGALVEVLFSDLIGDDTRAHVYRRPLERVQQVAPFLAVDTDPYAVPAQGGVMWMVNALTTSDTYPYSGIAPLGTDMDLRTETRPLEYVNYVADTVKAVVNATTGQVTMYRISDEPVIATWAAIYPDLFQPAEAMPEDIRAHMQYPLALMGIQFNMIYPYYHPRDPLTFYSGEDQLDDADEVIGAIRTNMLGNVTTGALTFTQAIAPWMAKPGGNLPDSERPVQFALSKTYTPQDALNLRAIAVAYQSGSDYGKLAVLKVPKGEFFLGPEQADAMIDQDSFIAQQIGLWNRLGVEVIRGGTSTLVVGNELLYVEPIFIRSKQNPIPQLQRVIVVFRGQAHMGRTVEEALSFAVLGGRIPETEDACLEDM